jgi:hypothetical protein
VWGYLGPDSTDYFNYYELKSDYGWNELVDFFYTFNFDPSLMEEVLNVDQLLWMLAFDNLMINLDAPINFAHNFYLYKDAAGRFNPMLWDLNENFGAFNMIIGGGPPLNTYAMQTFDPFFNISDPNYPIITQILPDPTYQKIYIAHMRTMLEELFSNGWYEERALEIQAIIDASVQEDPNPFYSYNEFLQNVYSSVGGGPMRIVGLVELMDPRNDFLLIHPVFQEIPPDIADVSHSPEIVQPNSTVWFNATVVNADQVLLAYRQSFTGQFEKVEMFDDGNHNDGLAGDGIYGISADAGFSDLYYYVFAENPDAASLSPPRAEYELYTVSIAADLYLNEFMADNETTIADPQGEYEDWIELYNDSDEDVSLTDYYLTDDFSIPDKWAFPDTSIAAGGFLLIWADEDEGDPGLHASFRLNRDGEEIGFYKLDVDSLMLIDQVIFPVQYDDISYGRYPDGYVDWRYMEPTPGYENSSAGIEGSEPELPARFELNQNYPNPFNPMTTIYYQLPVNSFVNLAVFDVAGRLVAELISGWRDTGVHNITFDASDLASGMYIYKIEAGDFRDIKKMVYVK